MISFPPGTEMFQFPGLPPHAYVFSMRYRRITSGGFPHSGIRGSQAIQRLPAAYRSRSRPSSTPGAKASTMCPSYLDGDHAHETAREGRPRYAVIPVCWQCCAVFKVRVEARTHSYALGARSLKTQQHAAPRRVSRPPGPVDMFGSHPAAPARNVPAAKRPLQSWSFPRKEVIQPHLPVRLPCYDFTPVTSPTFDGSLPKG